MDIEIRHERDGVVLAIIPDEHGFHSINFPRKNICDIDTDYQGPIPYHMNYCGYESCHPGYKFGPHIRSSYLMHLVLSGKGTYFVDNKEYRLSAGQIFLIYPGVTTTYQADAEDPWTYYWIGFTGFQANYIVTQMGFSTDNHVIKIDKPEPLLEIIRNTMNAHKITMSDELKRTSELLRFFAYVIENRKDPVPTPLKRFRSTYANVAMEYLSNNYASAIRIAALADYIGIDRSYLSKSFFAEYGMSPQECLLKIRTDKAARFLAESDRSISDIAESVGYPNALAFSKIFHQRYGISPTEYRKQVQEKKEK